jgi:hypothetical protein
MRIAFFICLVQTDTVVTHWLGESCACHLAGFARCAIHRLVHSQVQLPIRL